MDERGLGRHGGWRIGTRGDIQAGDTAPLKMTEGLSSPAVMSESTPHGPEAIRFAERPLNPLRVVGIRLVAAIGLVLAITLIVFVERDGYRDSVDGEVSALDALYYSTVSVTTTGYGDIVPVTDRARLMTVLVVTPMRVAFLILVVSTTVEVLAASSRYLIRVNRWRRSVRDHYVICGYGTKGRSAAASLLSKQVDRDQIIVVEQDAGAADEATSAGHTVVVGDCTRESVLQRAHVERAKGVVVAVDRDDTAVLATLTARLLNTEARLVAAVREEENSRILRRGGASVVITSDEATGRLLGLAIDSPHQAELIEDLLLIGQGADLVERDVDSTMVGSMAPEGTVGVIRHGRILSAPRQLEEGDRLLTIEANGE